MDAHWAFLRPWLEALQAVLARPVETSPRQDEQRSVCATFSCWKSMSRDDTVEECTLDVEFPADQASRRDFNRIQRFREAVTLFDTLAAVDNAAFVAALSEYMRLHHVQGGSPGAVWPEWRFSLDGFLSADDAVTKAPYVTWGELLLGSPEDRWEHSPEFRDAMEKLQGEGIGPMGSHRNRNSSAEWEIQTEVMTISGMQQLTPMKRKCRSLSDELGTLLTLEVPPVVVVESVSDSIALIKVWQAAPIIRCAGFRAITSTIGVRFAQCEAAGIGEVVAAIAHAKMQTFTLCLQDLAANDGRTGQAISNAGFLFSVLCSGRTVCHLDDATGFSALERHKSITCLNVIYCRACDLRFCAFFSAVAEGKLIRKLQFRTWTDGLHRDPLHWKWLAYALWSRASNACIPVLNLGRVKLTEEHVSAIEAVLKYSYPQPAEYPTSPSHSQYGFANIQAGTELRPVGLRAGDDAVLVVSRDLRCRAHYKSSSQQLDVVVPGYGICTMAANVDAFESDNVVGSSSRFLDTTETSCGVKFLIMSFSGIENDHLLPRLLALIGGRLQTLSLSGSFLLDRSVDLDLSSVAAACPELQTLRVHNFEVSFSDGNEALRYWKIKKLHIGGSDVDGLIRLLDDPTYRTSRELVELRLDRRAHGRLLQSRFTPDDLNALKAHDGEFLPVAKKMFPPSSRNAFIRLLRCRPAGRLLDSNMLSIVFAFAATPEQRKVVIL